MARVLVDRPRHGARLRLKRRKRYQAARRRPEEAPGREPMSRGRGTKSLNENLAPLERFLQRRVGRAWNAVYSEICARLRPTSAVQQHLRDHLADFVSTRTWIEDSVVLAQGRSGRPVSVAADERATRFYVCPRTGRLRERRRRRRRRSRPELDPEVRWDGPGRQLRRIEGVWYALELAPVPGRLVPGAALRDRFLGRPLGEILRKDPALLEAAYGRTGVYAAAKRQLSTRELRRLEDLPAGSRRVGR